MDDHLAFVGHNRSRDWITLSHGLHWQPSWPDASLDLLAAHQLVLPGSAAFSHLTAAQVYGWQLPVHVDHPIFVAQAEVHDRNQRDGLFSCRHTQPFPMTVRSGVRICTPAETLLACARDLGILDLVALGDQALRQRDCTVVDLWDSARRRRRGAPLLRRAIPLLDPRSETPWESIMRVLHQAADIDVDPQVEIHDGDGRFVARADLVVRGTRRLHEHDGAVHRTRDNHARDLQRDRALLRANWERVGLTSRDLVLDAARIIADTDGRLGRRHEPRRVVEWRALIARSLLDRAFRERAHRRWRRPFHQETGD